MTFAPNRSSKSVLSTLESEGTQITHLRFNALAHHARDMPVDPTVPEVRSIHPKKPSYTVSPSEISFLSKASSKILFAIRSFEEPPGLRYSHFTKTLIEMNLDNFGNRMVGVFPTSDKGTRGVFEGMEVRLLRVEGVRNDKMSESILFLRPIKSQPLDLMFGCNQPLG